MMNRWAAAALTLLLAPLAMAGPPGLTPLPVAPAAQPVSPAPRKWTYSDKSMGTQLTVTVWHPNETLAATAASAVFAEFARLDALMTTWTTTSDIAKVNAAAGRGAVAVSPETFAVVTRAVDMSRLSGGVFDITIGAYKGLWKFDEDMDHSLPAPAAVKARTTLVNWRRIKLNPKRQTVRLTKKGMAINLGGITKGYAVDRGVAILRERGLTNFIVQAGGDMYVAGSKDGAAWQVGIRDPRAPAGTTFASAPIADAAFSTSGDYERGFVKDGVRYHHILDPRTGYPAKATRAVTVRAPDAFTADAWSKILFILGPTDAMALVEARPELGAVFVGPDNRVHISTRLADVVHVQRPPTDGL